MSGPKRIIGPKRTYTYEDLVATGNRTEGYTVTRDGESVGAAYRQGSGWNGYTETGSGWPSTFGGPFPRLQDVLGLIHERIINRERRAGNV